MTIKECGCAEEWKLRSNTDKFESSPPTIFTKAVLSIFCNAAKENRDVASVNVPKAFTDTDLKCDKVHTKLKGRMVVFLAMTDPTLYGQLITVVNGKPVLFAEMQETY